MRPVGQTEEQHIASRENVLVPDELQIGSLAEIRIAVVTGLPASDSLPATISLTCG